MKKVMFGDCGGGCCARLAFEPSVVTATDATIAKRLALDMSPSLFEPARRSSAPCKNLARNPIAPTATRRAWMTQPLSPSRHEGTIGVIVRTLEDYMRRFLAAAAGI